MRTTEREKKNIIFSLKLKEFYRVLLKLSYHLLLPTFRMQCAERKHKARAERGNTHPVDNS